MNAYNPNYFNRSNVNSMKNALRKIIVSEQFPGSEQGQPGMSISGISDLELQKRMRNKKNTSIFNNNPKQSDEYLELEAEYKRRNTQQQQAPMGAMPGGQQQAQQAQQAQQTTPTNVTPGTVGITNLDGSPISVSPQTPPEREMSPTNTGQNFQQRFGIKIPIVQVTNQMNQFAKAEKEKQAQIDSGQGAYSPTDKASAERGKQSDWSSGYDNSPIGSLGLGSFKYGGKPIPNQSSIPPSVTPTQTAPTPVDIPDDAEPSLTQKFLDIYREPEKQSKPNRFYVKTNHRLYSNLPS